MTVAIDWENLGFAYMKLPYRYIATTKWSMDQEGIDRGCSLAYYRVFSKSPLWTASIWELAIVPGRQCSTVPSHNPKIPTLQLLVTVFWCHKVPTEMFVEACKAILRANEEYVPTIWNIRWNTLSPSTFDWCWKCIKGQNLQRITFSLSLPCQLATAKNGLVPTNFLIQDDLTVQLRMVQVRPRWWNYAANSPSPGKMARITPIFRCYLWNTHLHTKLKKSDHGQLLLECGANNEFVTPLVHPCLPSITKYSLLAGRSTTLGLNSDWRWCPNR